MEGSPGATHRLHICFQCFVRAGSLEVKTFSKCPEEELGPGSHAPKGHGNPRPRWSPGVTRKCVWFSPWSSPNPRGKAPQAGAALGGAGRGGSSGQGQAGNDSEASRHSATPHRLGEGDTSEIRDQCWRASEPRERAAVSTRAWERARVPVVARRSPGWLDPREDRQSWVLGSRGLREGDMQAGHADPSAQSSPPPLLELEVPNFLSEVSVPRSWHFNSF